MNDEMTMQTETTVANLYNAAQQISVLTPAELLLTAEGLNQLGKVAKWWASADIVPQNYQGKPANCAIAIEMAARMGISPMIIMQNMYVVKGKPCWSGQACIMLINHCGKFTDVHPVYTGERGTDTRGCYFSAVRITDGEKVEGTEVTMQMAKSEGWTSNPKWRNMPEQMLAYRAAAFFARIHCPEALMGAQTVEEVQDVNSSGANALTTALKGGEPNA